MVAAATGDLSVLLVEDNPADARLVREMLKESTAAAVLVTHVSRLRDAVGALRTQGFNAILLDLTLPDSDGLETFVRARAEARQAPIVVLTGLSDEKVAATAVREGAQDYLVKGQVDGRLLYQSLRFAVERHAVTEALKRSEGRYRSLVEGSIQGILIHVDGIVHFVNQALLNLLGIEHADDIVGQPVWPFIFEDDRHMVAEIIRARREGRTAPGHYELRAVRRDGSLLWLDTVTSAIQWDDTPATLATIIDMTERKRVEHDLRLVEERFRQLVENIKEAFIVIEVPSFRASFLSRVWADIWGRPLEEAYDGSPTWFQAIHPEDRAAVEAGQAAVVRGEAATTVFRIARPDGSIRWVRSRTFPVFNSDRRVYRLVGLVEDITDFRQTEEQLRHAQKMEAVGRLAGGVAHDFNNLLTAIIGYSDLVLDDLGAEHAASGDVREILKAAHSAESLTRQLLAFSRRQILQPQDLDLNEVLRRVQSLLGRVIGEDVALHLRLAPDLAQVSADPGQVEQVLMNLAVNARDAMPDGGQLTIETANVELDEEYTSHHAGASPGLHVMVAVSDTGVGMDSAVLKRLFEPFFTTKAVGKGTGLGLATVYGIVQQSRGSIWVYSEPGVGTTFKIYLPAILSGRARLQPLRSEPLAVVGNETVLVVEDQPETRAVVCEMLRRRGYVVVEAVNGEDAFETAAQYDGIIHVLLTDVVMPGIGGRQVAERLLVNRPNLRVIYMSGYTDDAILRHGILEAGLTFLQKPFTGEALFRKLREVLDGPPTEGVSE